MASVGFYNVTSVDNCPICFDPMNGSAPAVAHHNKGHLHPIHRDCIKKCVEQSVTDPVCPSCRVPVDVTSLYSWKERGGTKFNQIKNDKLKIAGLAMIVIALGMLVVTKEEKLRDARLTLAQVIGVFSGRATMSLLFDSISSRRGVSEEIPPACKRVVFVMLGILTSVAVVSQSLAVARVERTTGVTVKEVAAVANVALGMMLGGGVATVTENQTITRKVIAEIVVDFVLIFLL